MAFSELLSQINGGTVKTSSQSPVTTKPVATSSKDGGTANGVKLPMSASAAAPKRKADDEHPHLPPKTQKLGPGTSLQSGPSRSATSSPALKPGFRAPHAQAPQGSAKPKSGPLNPSTTQKPASGNTTAATAKPAAPVSGYLAALQRAQEAQKAAKTMGQIKHSKTQKLSRRERERLQAEAKAAGACQNKVLSGRVAKPVARSRDGTPVSGKGGPPQKERKPVEVGYKGTMRPTNQPAYRGTMHTGKAAAAGKLAAKPAPKSVDRYARWSDEDEEMLDKEDEEEEEGYDSASSDMEAGINEIDEEEMASTRVARKEDEEALRLENELKKQKLERKRKLEALQAAAAKKKKVY